MRNELFGSFVSFDVAGLRRKLGLTRHNFALALGVTDAQLKRLETDSQYVPYDVLSRLLTVSEKETHDLFAVKTSVIWENFKAGPNVPIAGRGRDNDVQREDSDCANAIIQSTLQFQLQRTFGDGDKREDIAEQLRSANCVVVGGPKLNPATSIALEAVHRKGGPEVSFLWPNCAREDYACALAPGL